jgi:site-specific DNA-methyltransferase (adenine-specific)
LQADGWYLRQDIIWHKPNPMPESVTDRCTKAHEYIFLLSKSARYFYDAPSIEEDAKWERWGNQTENKKHCGTGGHLGGKSLSELPIRDKKNKRSVWSIPTKSYRGAHFATFPTDLVRPCILAGCPTGGTVLDPFGGSGTTGQVAMEEGRKAILCELNPEYVQLINHRLNSVTPSLWSQPMEALK